MRIYALTFIFVFFSLYSKSVEELDKGFDRLKIDAKIETLKDFLIKITPEELWNTNAGGIGEYITSGWLYDFQKAGINLVSGLKIERIEVYFDGGYTSEGIIDYEDVYNFHLYLEKPSDNKIKDNFINDFLERYGDAMLWPDMVTGEIIRLDWFTDLTLLSVALGINVETGEEMKYYVVDFMQAYG